MNSASAPAPLVVERAAATKATALDSPSGVLANAVFALPNISTDFSVLSRRSAKFTVALLLILSPPPLVEAVVKLCHERSRLGQEEVLCRIRTMVREHALTCLRSKDWEKFGKKVTNPAHVGIVYAVLVTMSASDLYREFVRVLVEGQAISQMFHDQLGNGYKIMLSQVIMRAPLVQCPAIVLTFHAGISSHSAPCERREGHHAAHCNLRGSGASWSAERCAVPLCL